MGLFERLGREVEEFRQTARRTAAESADYRCRACGERLHTDHEQCPECGADHVAPAESDEAGGDGSGDTVGDAAGDGDAVGDAAGDGGDAEATEDA